MDGTETNSAGDHLGLPDRAVGVDCWRDPNTPHLHLWPCCSCQGGHPNLINIITTIIIIIIATIVIMFFIIFN